MLSRVIEADDVEGYADLVLFDDAGRPVFDGNGGVTLYRLTGHVQFIFAPA
jgi:hypothetical protein